MTGRTKLPNPRRKGEPITLDWIRSNCRVEVTAVPMTECWTWLGSIDVHGYGKTTRNGRSAFTHRVSFALSNMREPGPAIDHVCRNRACVNPDHLDDVTLLENIIRGDRKKLHGACPRCGSRNLAMRREPGKVTSMRCIPCLRAYKRAWDLSRAKLKQTGASLA